MVLAARTLPRFVFPLGLMAVIFALSAQPNLGTDLGIIDLIGRKIAHLSVYALLTLLWWWALDPIVRRPGISIALAAAVSFAYALSDEYHQSFVDGRVGSPVDVGIDTAGVILAIWAISRGYPQKALAAWRSRSGSAE